MGQVPVYGIIGGGRVASHFSRYFTLENLPFKMWQRGQSFSQPEKVLDGSDVILILIRDDAIHSLIQQLDFLKSKKLVHFSGSKVIEGVWGAHPLMTFGHQFFDLDFYRQIPFIVEDDIRIFEEYFPTLKNPHFAIQKKHKALYHAGCVMSGNFTFLLWQKFFSLLENINLPEHIAFPYLKKVMEDLLDAQKRSLTGPLARNDTQTIKENIFALTGDPFQRVYQAFVEAYENRPGF